MCVGGFFSSEEQCNCDEPCILHAKTISSLCMLAAIGALYVSCCPSQIGTAINIYSNYCQTELNNNNNLANGTAIIEFLSMNNTHSRSVVSTLYTHPGKVSTHLSPYLHVTRLYLQPSRRIRASHYPSYRHPSRRIYTAPVHVVYTHPAIQTAKDRFPSELLSMILQSIATHYIMGNITEDIYYMLYIVRQNGNYMCAECTLTLDSFADIFISIQYRDRTMNDAHNTWCPKLETHLPTID